MSRPQRTIANAVEYSGRGLFKGEPVTIRLSPAGADSGICFIRTDLPHHPRIQASVESIPASFRRTNLSSGGVQVEMVEHLLSALAGLNIDNIDIEIDGEELPCGDGSSIEFVELIQSAGIVEQHATKPEFVLKEPVAVTDGDISVVAVPYESGFSVSYTLDYGDRFLGKQTFSIDITEETYVKEIAPARTFCLSTEIDDFRRRGMGKGATEENVIVVQEDGRIDAPLRFPDECIRHKILDLMGDLYLTNLQLRSRVIGVRSGHAQNIQLAEKIVRIAAEAGQRVRSRSTVKLDIREIQRVLPHRYPFLLVDRVLEIDEEGRHAVGIKNVTFNEIFFQGHWPDFPVMPGVLQLEAMAQLAGILLLRQLEYTGKLTMLLSMDKVKIRRPVVPGDQLRLEAETMRAKSRTAQVYVRALVGGRVTAEAQLRFILVDAADVEFSPSTEM